MAEPIGIDRLTKTFLVAGLVLIAVIFLDYGSGIFIPLAVALLVWFLINAVAASYKGSPLAVFTCRGRWLLGCRCPRS